MDVEVRMEDPDRESDLYGDVRHACDGEHAVEHVPGSGGCGMRDITSLAMAPGWMHLPRSAFPWPSTPRPIRSLPQ